jgi:hydroxymethylglutaryl-CoA reductase (NADPH)
VKFNFIKIKEVAETTTRYGKLEKIEPIILGHQVILKLIFTTGDAQGLNMINKASQKVCLYIKEKTHKNFILRSHYSSIKGVSFASIHCGQAKAVMADITIPKKICQKVLRINPEDIEKYYKTAILSGIYSGRAGATCHAANAISAIFLACGQDIADISVSHVGITNFETTKDGDLYANVYIPNLFVGTVGGGTSLASQKECLELMGCYGSGKVYKLCEIIAAVVLAGEISVISALVSGNYVEAHEKHGRKVSSNSTK